MESLDVADDNTRYLICGFAENLKAPDDRILSHASLTGMLLPSAHVCTHQ